MARIAGVNIPDDKRIEIALAYIHGVGRPRSNQILAALKLDPNARTKTMNETDIGKLKDYIEKNFTIEGELKHQKQMNIKRLKDISCYRGIRHTKGLPARGQKTKTNTRTVRGNVRKTMGSGRKPAAEKT
ncbi:MAG: 30S ribosomal protein S13 [Candidatus Moranbacteria bacterium CG_4_10_14_3_um_filter_44_15]|nr:MAG: 30S ribosomal protein S13 [Candidatus Moranbacteria bacterium CG06_land_8_20_14_3_00_43_56]PIV83776.1 MAG: 30S ribosomal protein S13 [Candidatus Moranbacteria bacterium CG17_big_fil_post_rev_8_21_14_2_50_44_12]PIW92970.1 MAG: 30S ribosomal protein S13 [Candidatus Moranbacteria bacterium CG_4_8_14_3_um_filter_43_15]PIX90447.1 MAG: 30S ribosomal protein S13 [Candidatus Moranbacteria bacterium CG_4_10_14_3_um_filter_44_15]PJA85349.1 MAG: 30S ribosomal protein S13 [Candidatus Moranbacteria 